MKNFSIVIVLLSFAVQAAAATLEEQAKAFVMRQQEQITANLDITDDVNRFETLFNKIDEIFATGDIYRFAVARYAKLIDDRQKAKIVEFFKKSLILTYAVQSKINAKNLSLKIDQVTAEDKPNGQKFFTLNANVIDTQKTNLVKCDFVLIYANGKFLVYDIKIENVSMLITFRNMFASMVQSGHNDIELLMKDIELRLEEINRIIYGKDEQEEKEIFILQE